MKTFNIGNNRILKLVENNDEIHILDKTSMKEAVSAPGECGVCEQIYKHRIFTLNDLLK